MNITKDLSLLDFVKKERLIALTAICSIVTMQFLNSFKYNLLDPTLDFMIPEEKIDFLNVTIRDGVGSSNYETKRLTLDFGQVLKEFVKWLIVIFLVYSIYVYVS
jgi:large-conductance mechanosensitive channel